MHDAAGAWNAGPRVVKWLGNGTSDSQEGKNNLRYHANCSLVLEQSSWHCSDCFATIAQVQKKIKSFCHSDKNRWALMRKPHMVNGMQLVVMELITASMWLVSTNLELA